jgi:hypothetical protein
MPEHASTAWTTAEGAVAVTAGHSMSEPLGAPGDARTADAVHTK